MKIAYYNVHLGTYGQTVKIVNGTKAYDVEFSFNKLDTDLVKILKEQEVSKLILFAPKVIYGHIVQLIRNAELNIEIVN